MNYISLRNNQTIPILEIPELEYSKFMELNVFTLLKHENTHCVSYYGVKMGEYIKLICCIADDSLNDIKVSTCKVNSNQIINSFSHHNLVFEKFEREIHENFGINYKDHPWLKPVRFPNNRFNKGTCIKEYPFYAIDSEELHEVGVGPIHAGIIEPGHFRFICNGEQILHLETQFGYQHRGIEQLFLTKKNLLQRITLSENIAGDSVVAHTLTFVNLWESLCNFQPCQHLKLVRTLALELERVAIHTGDLSSMCTDIGYQLGSAVFGRLRTPIINFFQNWCGNRLAKGLIRIGKTNFTFTKELALELSQILDAYEKDFEEISDELFSLPSVLVRFEKTGVITTEIASKIGTVGMAARMSNIKRDIRFSHPHDLYTELDHQPILKQNGDVYARGRLRKKEINQSITYIRQLIEILPTANFDTLPILDPSGSSFTISLVEGWRGEICHSAITDPNGELMHYKIKDPSFHNWLSLAIAVRNNEISDFPICNKSFDLSYCGHDL